MKTIVEKPISIRDRVRNIVENNTTLPTLDIMAREMEVNKANLSNEISVLRGMGWAIDMIGERGQPRGYVVTPPLKDHPLARSMDQTGIYRAGDGTFRADQKAKAKAKAKPKKQRGGTRPSLQETIDRRRNPQLDVVMHVAELDAKLTRYAKYFIILMGVMSVSIAAVAIKLIIN